MSPPQQPRQQTSNCSSLLIYRYRKDERLSWPSWRTVIEGESFQHTQLWQCPLLVVMDRQYFSKCVKTRANSEEREWTYGIFALRAVRMCTATNSITTFIYAYTQDLRWWLFKDNNGRLMVVGNFIRCNAIQFLLDARLRPSSWQRSQHGLKLVLLIPDTAFRLIQ